jgi:hypothetical protein
MLSIYASGLASVLLFIPLPKRDEMHGLIKASSYLDLTMKGG